MTRLRALSALIFLALAAPLQAMAQQTPQPLPSPDYYGPGPWHMWGGYGWGFWWMVPMMLFFALAAIVFVVAFFRAVAPGPRLWGPSWRGTEEPPADPSRSALRILNERFARGEIGGDEYREKKAAILSGQA